MSAPSAAPERTGDPQHALTILRRDGVAILTGVTPTVAAARAVAFDVLAPLAPLVPDPAPIKEGGGNADRSYENATSDSGTVVPFQFGHTDGFAYGDAYPDFIFLACVRAAAGGGGESYTIDTYAVLDELAASSDPEDASFLAFLTSTPIDQTEPGFQASRSVIAGRTAGGRRMVRWTPVQRPAAGTPPADAERQRAWLDRWNALANAASLSAPRFLLEPGDTLCLDNYRMLHGRTGFNDTERMLWRVWAWTSEVHARPSGSIFSDSRYAVTQ